MMESPCAYCWVLNKFQVNRGRVGLTELRGIRHLEVTLSMYSHSLLQGIFLTQGLNLGLLYCRQILNRPNH